MNTTCRSCGYGSYENKDVHKVGPCKYSTGMEACLFVLPIPP